MNRILTLSVITVVTAMMGTSIVAPAIADHGEVDQPIACQVGQIYDPNSLTCVLPENCPNGVVKKSDGLIHCLLDSDINDDKKVTLCHQPSNSKSNSVTIEVSSNAVEKHLAHGDTLGSCYI